MRTMSRIATLALTTMLVLPGAANAGPLPVDENVQISLEVLHGVGGVYAIVIVQATWGLQTEGDVEILVNGNAIKLEPISTSSAQYVATYLSNQNVPLAACARFDGAFRLHGDRWRSVTREACRFYSPVLDAQPSVAPLQRPIALAAPDRPAPRPVDDTLEHPRIPR